MNKFLSLLPFITIVGCTVVYTTTTTNSHPPIAADTIPSVHDDYRRQSIIAPTDTVQSSWRLVWQDEFNGAAGTQPDPSKWNLETGGQGWNNNRELQFYTDRLTNAFLDGNGHLIIRALREDYNNRRFTSARLNTLGKFEQTYGKFEARIKVASGQGVWPAFWMLGANKPQVGYPNCGEMDIMEHVGKEPYVVFSNLHGQGYVGSPFFEGRHSLPNRARFADDFHVFGMEWEPNVIRFYLGGVLVDTHTPAKLPRGKVWAYDHSMYMILNLAIGGRYPGNPDNTTVFPADMLVDYVRVYQR